MLSERLQQWIEHPEQLGKDSLYELKALIEQYPYFQTARLLYLKNLYQAGNPSFKDELRRSALYVADLSVLFYQIEGENYLIKRHDEEVQSVRPSSGTDRTLDLIDRFLSEMPGDKSSSLSSLGAAAVSDYTPILEGMPADSGEGGQPASSGGDPLDDDGDGAYLTETLAQIYIKQRRYDKALEIIRKINLKYPEKSAYFADQIRFLEKLIINAKTK